ncbi:antA/AntB antirepressor family protein [uncultured Thiodictyon sp.]|uniref:antA/AntB antirepressor family protein n=1 Tax=uncultured Thiodictyon sp. TaxID=1846217 RepID=UPI0025DA6CB1|nr:antA/AntB antirepressor family protein [uncultured Thiodictyon sp.]
MSDAPQDPSALVPSAGTQLVPVFLAQIGGVPAQVCDARTLHAFLQNGDKFAGWIADRIAKYDFQEDQDFALVSVNSEIKGRGGDRRSKDYHLSLDMAKELSMVENNAKGREARRYFIAMERQALAAAVAPTPDPDISPPIGLGDLVIRQDQDGRYCLDDLYQAAGAPAKHLPGPWLDLTSTQEYAQRYKHPGRPPVVVTPHGTFVEYGLVLAYGHSVSQDFHRQVSDAFVSAAAIRAHVWEPRMAEVRRLLAQPAPAALDAPLLPSEQQALASVIGARCAGLDATLQEGISAGLWSSLQRQFHIVEPAELPRSKLAEAIIYLTALPVALAPVAALPAPAAPVEVLTRDDRANLDRVLGLMTDHLFHARAWRSAIWKSLRAVTGTHSPQPFEVRHLPAMCAELRRLYAASAAWQDAVYEAEADLLRRVFRGGEDLEQVIAEQRAQQIAEGVERGTQLVVELAKARMSDLANLYARVPPARHDARPDLQE